MKMIFVTSFHEHEHFWIRADLIEKIKITWIEVGPKRLQATELFTKIGVFLVKQYPGSIADEIDGIVEADDRRQLQ